MSRDDGGAARNEDPGVDVIDASLSNVAHQAAERLTDASQGPASATTHLKGAGGARYISLRHALSQAGSTVLPMALFPEGLS